MRVLLLTWDFPPARGGIQVWMSELARRLPDAEVTVLAPSLPGAAEFDRATGVRVRRMRGAMISQSAWLLQLVIWTLFQAMVKRPDVIVCGHVVAGPAALLAKRVFKVPYVVFAYAFEIRRRRYRRYVTSVLQGAAQVLAISRFTRDSVLQHGVPIERVRVIYPGTERVRIPASEDSVTGASSDREGPTILAVSRLVDLYKGHDTVIRALPLIRSKCPGARYRVVGGGPLREYLERLAESLGVTHAVQFEGEVQDEQLTSLYQSCDVFVQLSREARSGGGAEGFGIVCLEASAAGKAVVAGRSGGLPDALTDGVTGMLVDPTDIGEVAEAIVTLLRDRELSRCLGREGRARVEREFTWDHMAHAARALFGEAAGLA